MKTNTDVLISLISFSLLFNALVASSSTVLRLSEDSITLNCGSSEDAVDVDGDGRNWTGDLSTKYLESKNNENSIQARAQFQNPSLPSLVPYMSAKIFTAEANYKFPVVARERHWVRLHFYPSSYSSLNPNDSYFAVTTGNNITLLSNFSASITAKALTQAYIIKEFSLESTSDGYISLKFTPSPKHNGSYAFINGIEVISMPDLYKDPATLFGFSDQSVDVGSSSLHTMYRLNVGGQYIPPGNDSGLSRTLYDDSPYIYGAGVGVTYLTNKKVVIRYPKEMPVYVAPVDVYSTARSLGPDPKVNMNYNLTWIFPVDGNFMYVVRFHFCELQLPKINQRVFDIYVNNQTAQESAEVIGWSGSKAVPVYKDYAVYVSDGPGDEQLWVALHPATSMKPEFYDAILNGLEIFKLNDRAGKLGSCTLKVW